MGVLIKGMEMPKNCDACSFACWSNLHQTGSCYLLDGKQCFDDYSTDYRTKRSEHCPLIEVPEPHGDLIDRDALSKSLNRLCDRVCQYSKAQRKFMCSACPLGDAFTVVEDDAPTVIPASESKERPAFLPQYELTPRSEGGGLSDDRF